MRRACKRTRIATLLGMALAALPAAAQQPPAAIATTPLAAPATTPDTFAVEQLDAMLAPIALYPDAVLAPLLMAASDPLQVVMATRWAAQPDHATLTGDALATALAGQDLDPAAKVLVAFPGVLRMLSDHLDWTMQVGYAITNQPEQVLDSLQRLRRQALSVSADAISGPFTVRLLGAAVAIDPASPPAIVVPSVDPAAYGAWPYAATTPVRLDAGSTTPAEPPASLRDLCSIAWPRGEIMLDVKRWNAVNGERPAVTMSVWQPHQVYALTRRVDVSLGAPPLPPGGPAGRPTRPSGIPANAIGRSVVTVSAELVRRPAALTVHSFVPPLPAAHAAATQASAAAAPPLGIHLAPLPAHMETARADALSDVAAGAQAMQFEARGAESRDPQALPMHHQEMAKLAP